MVTTRKKGLLAVLAVLAALCMALFVGVQVAQAAGTEVQYTNDDYGGHNLQITDGGEAQQVFCVAQGRPWGINDLPRSGVRIKYAWDANPEEYNAIANAGNSLMGGPYTYALSWAIVGGAYTSESNVRPEMQPGKEGFSPMDDMTKLARILKNIFYYAKVDGHSDAEIQQAIYDVITGGDTDTMPRGWNSASLEAKAWSGGDIGKDTELWVYLPHPDAFTRGNGMGYNITSRDQAFVRGVPNVGPKVAVYLHGIKELKGGQLQDEQFSFTISGPGIEETTKVNYGADIWFPELTFDKAGDYTYTLKEVKGDAADITYDEKEKTLVVNVTDDGNGKLIASVDGVQIATSDDKKEDGSPKAGEIDGSVDKYKFVNTYGETYEPKIVNTTVTANGTAAKSDAPAEVTVEKGDKVTISDVVELSGLDPAKAYTLTCYVYNVDVPNEPVKGPVVKQVEKAATEVPVEFEDLTIDAAGEFTYSVRTELSAEGMETITHNGEFDVKSETVVVTSEEPTEVTFKINKTDMDGKEVDGAEIVVKDAEGNEVATWISKEGETKDITVKPGDYTLVEKTAPSGYQTVTTEIEFNVDKDGKVTVKTTEVKPAGACEVDANGVLVLKDAIEEETPEEPETVEVKISKQDMGGTEVEGAKIKVTSAAAEGTFSEEWESTKDVHTITVEPGNYILEETVAPEGYQKVTTQIKFIVDKDGFVTVTTTEVEPAGACVYDEETGVLILKDAIEETPDQPKKGELATTVDGASKDAPASLTADEAAAMTEFDDTIDYTDLVPGATYGVTGTLMEIANGTATPVLTSDTLQCKADESGSGKWTITFHFDAGTLEAGKTYVVYEKAVRVTDGEGKPVEDGETLTHEDKNDKAQTIVVEKKESSDNPPTPTPSDDEPTPTPSDDTPSSDDTPTPTPTPSDDKTDPTPTPTPTPSDETVETTVTVRTDSGNKVTITDSTGKVIEEWTSTGSKDVVLKPGKYTVTVTDKDGNKATEVIEIDDAGKTFVNGSLVENDTTTLNPVKRYSSSSQVTSRTTTATPASSSAARATTTSRTTTSTARTADDMAVPTIALGILAAAAFAAGVYSLRRRKSDR